jgi:hypothetical protein
LEHRKEVVCHFAVKPGSSIQSPGPDYKGQPCQVKPTVQEYKRWKPIITSKAIKQKEEEGLAASAVF